MISYTMVASDTVLEGGGANRWSAREYPVRAIMKDTPIVILDEGYGSVDPENEHLPEGGQQNFDTRKDPLLPCITT